MLHEFVQSCPWELTSTFTCHCWCAEPQASTWGVVLLIAFASKACEIKELRSIKFPVTETRISCSTHLLLPVENPQGVVCKSSCCIAVLLTGF
jgi:hypothetical protein